VEGIGGYDETKKRRQKKKLGRGGAHCRGRKKGGELKTRVPDCHKKKRGEGNSQEVGGPGRRRNKRRDDALPAAINLGWEEIWKRRGGHADARRGKRVEASKPGGSEGGT